MRREAADRFRLPVVVMDNAPFVGTNPSKQVLDAPDFHTKMHSWSARSTRDICTRSLSPGNECGNLSMHMWRSDDNAVECATHIVCVLIPVQRRISFLKQIMDPLTSESARMSVIRRYLWSCNRTKALKKFNERRNKLCCSTRRRRSIRVR